MPLALADTLAAVTDALTVEEAEALLAWLLDHPGGGVDLARCTHLHAANLQVLMAARPPIAAWPDAPDLRAWLQAALGTPMEPS